MKECGLGFGAQGRMKVGGNIGDQLMTNVIYFEHPHPEALIGQEM